MEHLPSAYHLPPGSKLNEAISSIVDVAVEAIGKPFKKPVSKLGENGETGTAITNERWLLPLFNELDYGRLVTTKSPVIDERSYPIERFYNHTPIHLIGCKLPLDRRTKGARGAATASPHSMVQEFLNRSDEHLWAFLSNGLQLRILRDNVSLSRQTFVEFDLEAMMEGEVYADFALLWLLVPSIASRIRQAGRLLAGEMEQARPRAGHAGLERPASRRRPMPSKPSVADSSAIPATTDCVKSSIRERSPRTSSIASCSASCIGCCFCSWPKTATSCIPLSPRERAGLKGRKLATCTTRITRRGGCGNWLSRCGAPSTPTCGIRFRWCSTLSARTKAARSLVFLGSARSCGERAARPTCLVRIKPMAKPSSLRMTTCCKPFEHWPTSSKTACFGWSIIAISAAKNSARVYESLLELHPVMDVEGKSFDLMTAAGNERKTTGSYYTPDSLVQCLLDSALDPVVEDRLKGKKGEEAEKAILDIKVCDPASGSGHFLIAAAHRLARHLARARTGEAEPSPEDYQHALRDVIGRCLYGVDINPMAVELCKVSLWMEAIEPGKPLSFLDHHIQCGNSLLGTTPALLGQGNSRRRLQAYRR